MNDETNVNEQVPTPEQVLVEMRENMVPKEEAQKWQTKYNELFRSVANGSFSGEDKPQEKSEEEKKADFEATVKRLGNASNKATPLELFQAMLDVDDYLTSHGQRSGFAPSEGEITPEIENSCEKTRELLESVIEQSEGSNEVALAYLGNHLTDPVGLLKRSR